MTVSAHATDLAEAVQELAELIGRAETGSLDQGEVFRLETTLGDVDPLVWLAAQDTKEKCYWRSRDTALEIAGIGAAHTIVDTGAKLYRIAPGCAATPLRYFNGQRFDPGYPAARRAAAWDSLGDRLLLLSRFELLHINERTVLAVNLTANDTNLAQIAEQARGLAQVARREEHFPALKAKQFLPERSDWLQQVALALDEIGANRMKKLVLARETSLEYESDLDPWLLLNGLRQTTQSCFLFGFCTGSDITFIGASPERLYRRDGHRIVTEAIAGTRPRGDDPDNDNRLAAELRESQKERWEQRLVVDGLESGLNEVCDNYRVDRATGPLKLARLQHLVTRLEGKLAESATDDDILAALHPSPAIGGYPTDSAREKIRKLEQFDRGWYAGPVGWRAAEAAEYAVGIRSGLVCGNRLHLYSGAGIVEGSSPEEEWREVDSKTGPFLRLWNRDHDG